MTAQASEWTTQNVAWSHARPFLSVLIPTYRDDPVLLLAQLNREKVRAEVIVLDDGSGDAELALRIAEAIEAMSLPARFVRLTANEGRAKGRNRLVAHARAERLLFLDADMAPDSDNFLRDWLDLANERDPAVAFGGFSLKQAPPKAEHALHRAMALKSDCLPAAERALAPEKHVFTSNLLVRRDVFETVAFDEAFTGWGWEDVEWAMRVSRAYEIVHADITATHLGLDSAATMARKYEQSAGNFARVVAAHREIVETYPSYRAARLLKKIPLRPLWRPILKAVALAEPLPLKLRDTAMRAYRAALYAEAV